MVRISTRHIGLFALGCALGLSVPMLRNGLTLPETLSFTTRMVERSPLASAACVPHAEEDDIFFVTCGGIY